MKKTLIAFLLISALAISANAQLKNFITKDTDNLMDGGEEFRFISFNIPCLHYNEDNFPFKIKSPWRLPDEFEIRDALGAIKQMGGNAARIFTFSVVKKGEDTSVPKHVLSPGEFNEEAFKVFDKVLQIANEMNIRLIIPFTDDYIWWGGVPNYAEFSGKKAEDFYTDPQVIADFKKTIEYVLNRTNTYTGIKYKDDKAVLCWETGNELRKVTPAWTSMICKYIKGIDKNHLTMDGFHTTKVRPESIDDPYVDIVTTHYYPSPASPAYHLIDSARENRKLCKGKCPYIIGEFGFVNTAAIEEFLDFIIDDGINGACIWSLRYRSRDGGFYWHTEPFGGNRFRAYHWPGFDSGGYYDEKNLLNVMREKAFQIRGLETPPLEKPAPPVLLPITDVAAINFQGSVGAQDYDIQRSDNKLFWKTIAKNISDARYQYRDLFNDETAKIGKKYYYRVIAKNSAGKSTPSNIVGPVNVKYYTITDEMADHSMIYAYDKISFEKLDRPRIFKEDSHRVKANKDSFIIYKTKGTIENFEIYSFFEGDISDFKVYASADRKNYTALSTNKTSYYVTPGPNDYDYGYAKPVLYYGNNNVANARYLKIEFTNNAQLSRVEIKSK